MVVSAVNKFTPYSVYAPIKRAAQFINKSQVKKLGDNIRYATEHVNDFIISDRSMNPVFLKSLLKIKGKNVLETCTEIKNKILSAIGYPEPDELPFITGFKGDMGYNPLEGNLLINTDIKVSKDLFIAAIRHELDHMEKFIKLYKALGEEEFTKMQYEAIKRLNPQVKLKIEHIKDLFNKNFYESMSKYVSLEGFDSEKYKSAVINYQPDFFGSWSQRHAYYNNPMEYDAYEISSKVQGILGLSSKTAASSFSEYNTYLNNFMKKGGVPEDKWISNIDDMMFLYLVKYVEDQPDNIKKTMNIYFKMMDKKLNNPDDINFLQCVVDKMPKSPIKNHLFKQIEAWFKEGKYTVKDVLKDM